MFEDLVESSATKKKTNKSWAVVVSLVVQCLVVFILILIPLIYTQALPTAMLTTMLVAPPPPPPPPPPAPPAAPVRVVKPTPHFLDQNKLITPKAIPKQVEMVKEEAPPPDLGATTGGVPGGVIGGVAGGVLGGVLGGVVNSAAPPPPPPPAPPPPKAPSGPVKIGGQVQQAKAIAQPAPVYPLIARDARISGAVVLHAIIGKDGSISRLEVVSGNSLLVQSAMDAVKQWRYRPTLLNGEPVEVDTTITVNFVLGS